MGESHSYGTACGCISRRLFVFFFCCVMTVICVVQMARWLARWHFFDTLVGASWQPAHSHCVETSCYEVLSCFGMREATHHVREPLASASGLLFFPLGAYASSFSIRRPLQLVGTYLTVSAAVHAGLVVTDVVYYGTCDAYPENVVMQTLANRVLPPSPLLPAARNQLLQMTSWPADAVDRITGGFQSLTWYIVLAGLWALLLAYASWEARLLGDLVERGPLGLGVHYGLGQWDEIISHDAVRRHKEREMRSQFIDDARTSAGALSTDAEMPASRGHRAGTGWVDYGATNGAA